MTSVPSITEAQPFVSIAGRRIARCGPVADTWSIMATKIAITSFEASVCALRQGTKSEPNYQHWQASYHCGPVNHMVAMIKITYPQQLISRTALWHERSLGFPCCAQQAQLRKRQNI